MCALFLLSFAAPAIVFRQVSSHTGVLHPVGQVIKSGKQMALASLFGPFVGNFAGFANPLLLAGCIFLLLRKLRSALVCLGCAVLLALQTFQLMVAPYYEDEGGVLLSYMVRPLAGWYLWFGAIALAFALAVEQRWSSGKVLGPP